MTVTRPEIDRKIAAFRARADEIRAVLEDMHDPDARHTMSRLAETYEKAARHLKDLHIIDEPESDTG